MPLQDLTPQLRTRLNRMERAVGWFITGATLILICGFGYYIYNTANQRGWFASKARYYTYAKTGAGLAVGEKVELMGFAVGEITRISPEPPRKKGAVGEGQNVRVEFEVVNDKEKYSDYIWTQGSVVRFADAGFLGNRVLDVTRGTPGGRNTYLYFSAEQMSLDDLKSMSDLKDFRLGQDIYDPDTTNFIFGAWTNLTNNLDLIANHVHGEVWVIDHRATNSSLTAVWNAELHHYEPITKDTIYYLKPDEPPGLSDRAQAMVAQLQTALPLILQLTNQLATVLSNATVLTSNLAEVSQGARVSVTNLAVITTQLRNPEGSLGEWLFPTNINQKLDRTLDSSDKTINSLNTNLVTLNLTLDNVANITSNLNNQVQANTNILSNISGIVVHSDEFIQGLKRFWLFRHLFATHAAKKPDQPVKARALSPKERGQ